MNKIYNYILYFLCGILFYYIVNSIDKLEVGNDFPNIKPNMIDLINKYLENNVSAKLYTTESLLHIINEWDGNASNSNNKFFNSTNPINNIRVLASFFAQGQSESLFTKNGGGVGNENRCKDYDDYADDSANEYANKKTTKCPAFNYAYGIYWGRGFLQLTCWGGNYCSNYENVNDYYKNKNINGVTLLPNTTTLKEYPNLVAHNSYLAWGSGLYYFMKQPGLSTKTPIEWIKTINNIEYTNINDYNQQNIDAFIGTYESINDCLACSNEAKQSRIDRYNFYVEIFNDLINTYNMLVEYTNIDIIKYKLKDYDATYTINCPTLDENSNKKYLSGFNISKNLTLNNNKYQKICLLGCKAN